LPEILSPKQLPNYLPQNDSELQYGYNHRNLINLLVKLKADLAPADFSSSNIRHFLE
jgi:hypothetical protein